MMDISGSMRHLYNDGTVQEVLNHVLGLAMNFDPSHRLDVFVFDDKHAQLPVPATPANFHGYVERQILTEDAIPKLGLTKYAGVMHQFQDHYFGEHPDHAEHRAHHGLLARLFHHEAPPPAFTPEEMALPVLGLLITDGENDDHHKAEVAVARSRPYPVFWSLVGVGAEEFRFLRKVEGEFEDAEFIDLEHLHIPDEVLYAELVSPKLTGWLRQHPPR